MWGGNQPGLPEVHDSEEKKASSSVMEVCHLASGRWEQNLPLVLLRWDCGVMQLLSLEGKYSSLVDTAVMVIVYIIVYLVLMLIPSTGRNSLLLVLTMVL